MTRSPSPTAFLVPIITTLLWTACVPARQYEEMDARYQAMQAEAQAADARAREAVTRADELGSQLEELQRRDRRLE
nr:hypothetical protein [Flavobacteriales bacterium]